MNMAINQTDLFKTQALFAGIQNGLPRVIMRTANKTMTGVKTDIVTEVRMALNVKATAIRKQIKINKASVTDQGASVVVGVDLSGRPVAGGGRGMRIIDFANARQTRKGVTVEIKKGGGRKLIPGAFKAKMKSGHVGIFKRAKYSRLRDRREPIKEVHSTSVVDALSNAKVVGSVETKAMVRMDKNLKHETDFMLSKL